MKFFLFRKTKSIAKSAALIVLPISFSLISLHNSAIAGELPRPIIVHYENANSIYWKIRQLSISPIFDRPETTIAEFYLQRPSNVYIKMPGKQIFTDGDTLWTYLVEHKQIQKSSTGHIFNPFDIIDSKQTLYDVIFAEKGQAILKNRQLAVEPDSLCIRYQDDGTLKHIIYVDVNNNEIKLEFIKESFAKKQPRDIFVKNRPKDVQIIEIDKNE